MKTFVVKDYNGNDTEVQSTMMGVDERVLYFLKDNERVAVFSQDSWISCVEKPEPTE